jgi:hypothetical protein
VVDAREPKDFFTDLERRDYDGNFDWTPRSTRPTLSFDNDPDRTTEVGNATAGVLPGRDILSVNDNGGERGFDFRSVQVRQNQASGNFTPVPNAYAVLDGPRDRLMPQGVEYCVALLSRRRTDSLLVDIREWPAGIYADPTKAVGRAAWYSFAFFLRIAAAELLDTETLELDAGFRTRPRDGRPAGQAFLCDKLENGAGYCTRLSLPDQFTRLLAQSDLMLRDSIAEKWLAANHATDCDTSCNLCLRDFYNMPYHGLLDWRLGLDMAKLTAGGHIPDLDSQWGLLGNPWQRIVGTLPAILRRLDYDVVPAAKFGTLTGFIRPHRIAVQTRILILRHPLWTENHPTWVAAVADAQQQYPGTTPTPINPFTAIRRPAEYA